MLILIEVVSANEMEPDQFMFIIHTTRNTLLLISITLPETHRRHWTHINVCRVSCGGVSNTLLVLSITYYFYYNIWGCTCSNGLFTYRRLKGYVYRSCYYHHQIGSIHLSHCFHTFPCLCAWDVCYVIYCHLLYVHSVKTGNLFSLVLCSLWWVQIVGYVLACRSYSFVWTSHHLIIIIVQTLSEDIELVKCLSGIIRRSIYPYSPGLLCWHWGNR